MRIRERAYALEVARGAIEVDRDDGFGTLGNRIRDPIQIHKVAFVAIHEHWLRAAHEDGHRRREGGIHRHDDLVAASDPGGEKGEVERVGARIDADALRHADVCGELVLEPFDLGPQDEMAARHDARKRRVDVGLEVSVFAAELVETDHRTKSRNAGYSRR